MTVFAAEINNKIIIMDTFIVIVMKFLNLPHDHNCLPQDGMYPSAVIIIIIVTKLLSMFDMY